MMGRRNVELTRQAGVLRAQGHDEEEILARLLADLERDGLPESEVRTIARSAMKWPKGEPARDHSKEKHPDSLHELAARRGWSVEVLKAVGAIAKGGEVHFPMRDASGEVTGWRRRRGDNRPFGDSRKCLTVKDGRNGLLCPWPIPAGDPVLLTEGEMDVCAALSAGHAAVIGTPGAQPGRHVIEALQTSMAGREVVLAPDPDIAGDGWREKIGAALVHAGCKVRFIPAGDVDLDKRLRRSGDPAGELARLIGLAVEVKASEAKAEWTGPRPLTDLGAAERFRDQHQGKILYDVRHGAWRVWDGRRWVLDTSGAIMRLAHQTARSIYTEAKNASDPDTARALARFAARCENRDRLLAMVDVAKDLEGVTIDPAKFDADPWLLNCMNGTIELQTGEIRPHRREDYMTKMCPEAYDPAARSDVWDRVLRDALDDEDAIRFLQKAAGYTLTGDTREEKLFLILGPEATGKSTLLEAIKAAMGDYALTASFDTFTRKQGDGGVRNDIARLQGARLVACSEAQDGKAFDEALVKSLTGGDTITARYLYRESFEFVPGFKLWLAANHAPRVDADDGGMWRRSLRVPFERTIPKDRRDATIKPFLKDPQGGGPAVLTWAVQGSLMWQAEGLRTPAKVEEATCAYRDDMDPIRDFLADCCKLTANGECTNKSLRDAYEAWCRDNSNKYPISPKKMAEKLQARGCQRTKLNGQRGWSGIALSGGVDTLDTLDRTFNNFSPRWDFKTKLPEMVSNVSNVSTKRENIIKNNSLVQFKDADDLTDAEVI